MTELSLFPLQLPALLVSASAAVVGVQGALHLWLTFRGASFAPRDAELEARMKAVSPRITRQTTLWRAGLGFHASHSLGAMLFALVYAQLVWVEPAPLWQLPLLQALGLVYLLAMGVLARLFWFRVPQQGLLLALLFYVSALWLHWA